MTNDNTYIMNLEASFLYKAHLEGKDYDSASRSKEKLFSATMPCSLEVLRTEPDEFYIENDKQYTKLFVNVTFDKNCSYTVETKEKDENGNAVKKTLKVNKLKIRKHIYNNGFTVIETKDGKIIEKSKNEYVYFKRGSNKAKNGSNYFVKKEYYDILIKRGRLNVEFLANEKIDLTSVSAYESLILSGIENTIDIKKDEILLIDDIYGDKFNSIASVTEIVDGEVVTMTKEIELQNCLSDGQGLLDESVFNDCDKKYKSFMLLRSDWLKSCAFNTKLRDFWESRGIKFIYEKIGGVLTGRKLDTSKIKLVITPNSLKFLKLSYKFNSELECYLYWLDNIDSTFGVVKCDKAGNFGTSCRSTYQLLNSLPLSYDEVEELAKDEIDYVMSLKDDFTVFRNYIGLNIKEYNLLIENIGNTDNEIEADISEHEDEKEADIEDVYKTLPMINSLLYVNSAFQYTEKFKNYKKELIKHYIENLRHGKLRMRNTLYTTIFSNPYEMLLATIEQYKQGDYIAKGREMCCTYYKKNQELCVSRNPHVNAGNVAMLTNKYHKEYKWFNLSKYCCIVNFADNDLPDRLQGCDTDSDTILHLPHLTLVEKAKYCEMNFPTPIKNIQGKVKNCKNNLDELAKLNRGLSCNLIGKVINKSQIVNSYMQDYTYNKAEKGLIDKLYESSSKLSSLSQIEIDKAKKNFDTVKMTKELNDINKIKYGGEPIIKFTDDKKMIVPNFFKYVADESDYREYKKFNCPMDYLQEILDDKNNIGKTKKTPKIDFKDILVKQKDINDSYNTKQIDVIYGIVKEQGGKLKSLKCKTCELNKAAKQTVKHNIQDKAINELKTMKINSKTILAILKQAFGVSEDKKGFKKYSMDILNFLYLSHPFKTMACFINTQKNDEYLMRDKQGEVDIFGEKYTKKLISDINEVA